MAAALDEVARRDRGDPGSARPGDGDARAAALADDRAAHAEGLDRPEGRRRQAGRGHAGARTRCRSPTSATTRSTSRQLEALAAQLPARRAVRRRAARCGRSSPRSPRPATRRMSANPHANGGLLLHDLRLPDFRDYAVDVPTPGTTHGRGDPRARRRSCATSIRRNPTTFRIFGPGRDRLEPAGRGVRGHRPRLAGARSCRPTTTSRRTGRVMEVLSEHLCQGWLEGYLLTGRHGLFNCYEAFIHIIDSMFNQHAKWLKMTREIPWRRPIASLNYLLTQPRLAPGPQRLQPPGPGLHRPRGRTRRPRSSASTCRRTPTACCRSPTTACAAATTSTSSWPASSRRLQLPDDGRGRRCTAPAASASGTGPATTDGEPGRGHGLRRRRADAGDAGRRRPPAPAPARRCKVRVVNVVDLMRLQHETRAPARPVRPRVRRAVHDGPAGDLRLPRLPVADPPADLPAHEPRQPPRARLQGGGHGHDAVRHGHAQRPRPVPPRDGRDRPRARASARRAASLRQQMVDERVRARAYAARARRGPAGDPRLDLAGAERRGRRARPRPERGLELAQGERHRATEPTVARPTLGWGSDASEPRDRGAGIRGGPRGAG